MTDKRHLFSQDKTLLEALSIINELSPEPLVLFITDDGNRMVGTLTDGDSRRALIAGASVDDPVTKIMHRDFNYISVDDIDNVFELRRQKELKMKLVPILDKERHIVEIINLERYKTRLPIDAVLMAGGKGERLRPLTEKTPKPLLKVGDKAIIDHNVDSLISYGLKHISVTTNYLAEQLESHYEQPREEIQIQCVREPKFLGTMGAVRLIKEFHNDIVLVMNSDLFTDVDFEDMYLHFMEYEADMSVAAVPYSVSIPFGICDLDGRDVKGVIEKPTYNYYVNAGIYIISREVIDMIPKSEFYNATDLIDSLVKNGGKVIRYPLRGTWIDIGSISEYKKANELVKHMKL